ncbi:hypothetical protein B0H67DRAFT_638112 [Lasiosphaeris hirsuta]|uniref:Uncharacterized protein n=1 Tax=Lasiosphaeris hirsuta TaxID=260670 RepID=A0AA40B8D3_9PEZI|nr:hypothetical protein B0H67DRAFT_638112 [Lasiosphaeris hirsuta]
MALLKHLLDKATEAHKRFDYQDAPTADQAADMFRRRIKEAEAVILSTCGKTPAEVVVLDVRGDKAQLQRAKEELEKAKEQYPEEARLREEVHKAQEDVFEARAIAIPGDEDSRESSWDTDPWVQAEL